MLMKTAVTAAERSVADRRVTTTKATRTCTASVLGC